MTVEDWARAEAEAWKPSDRLNPGERGNTAYRHFLHEGFIAGAVARDEYLAERLLSDEAIEAAHWAYVYYPKTRGTDSWKEPWRAAIEAALAVATGTPEPRLVEPSHCGCPCHHDGGATKHITACCTTKSQTGDGS